MKIGENVGQLVNYISCETEYKKLMNNQAHASIIKKLDKHLNNAIFELLNNVKNDYLVNMQSEN